MCYSTVFALFYIVFEGSFQVLKPQGLIFGGGGDFTESSLSFKFGELIFGRAYFRDFKVLNSV